MPQRLDPNPDNPAIRAGIGALIASTPPENRVGWKIGINFPDIQARFGLSGPIVGILPAHSLSKTDSIAVESGGVLVIETELALRIGADIPPDADMLQAASAIEALAPAFELLRIDGPLDDLEHLATRNSYHAGFALGEWKRPSVLNSPEELSLSLRIPGEAERQIDKSLIVGSPPEIALFVARFVANFGAALRDGDIILSGCLNAPTIVQSGQSIKANLTPVGSISLLVTPK